MKKIFFIAVFNYVSAAILHVNGEEFVTIQAAIDLAQENDTIIVHNGIYFENLDINKTITLASLAIYDDLNSWYEFDSITEQHQVTNENIINTIIDGSQSVDINFQSGIVVRSPENECISPIIMGFTIRNSMGTMVTEEIPHTAVRMIGGGLFSYITNSEIHHNQFANNGGPGLQNGGAIYIQTNENDWDFGNRSSGRPICEIEEINLHDNFYRDNDAIYGNTFSNRTFTEEINFTNSLFDIYNCSQQNVTGIWVSLHPEAQADYTGIQGDLCAITDDVWVSPEGSDYNGLATEDSPVKTIKNALEIIAPTDENSITIHLDEGIFSPSSNGETFPIRMISNVNFNGEGEELSALNAEYTARVIILENCNNNIISNLKIEGGIPPGIFSDNSGGGISAVFSNPTINNVTFSENIAISGAGINLYESNAILNYVTISENTAHLSGGGISIISSNTTLNYVTIIDNNSTVGRGGGMYIDSSNPILNFVDVTGNVAVDWGGGIVLFNSNSILTNVNITNNATGLNGGGMGLINSNPSLTNVVVSNNISDFNGGGIGLENSNPILTNVTIFGNSTAQGGGMFLYESNPILVNSIIYGNTPESMIVESGEPIIVFSNIEGGWSDDGNMDQNPMFADSDNGDFTLLQDSPCIDAGTAYLDIEGEVILDLDGTEYFGDAPDMGANEYNPLSISNPISDMPIEYVIYPAYPNPFNPLTKISYDLPYDSKINLNIYDIEGRKVTSFENGFKVAGNHTIEWNADRYPSGIYFIKLDAGKFTQIQKLMLVK